MSELAVLTTPLGGPPLARLAGDGGAPAGWYRAQPRSAGAWRGEAEAVRAEYAGRDWVRTLAPAFEPSGPAAARLRRVADAGGIVVTTGQQPGLFGGPVYTWNKALSAIALADALERATGIPTAPVFWAATYDADFAEASASYVALGPTVQRLQMQPPPEEGRRMRDLPLGDVSALARELERAAGSAADPQVLALVARAYGPGETVGSAYVKLLRALLEPLGMAVLDAGHDAVLAEARALCVRALREAPAVDAALRAREREIAAHGYDPTVAHVNGLSLVFDTTNGARRRIPIAVAAAAADDPATTLEANVLLRPVAERAVLPSVAYVAGPSEIAYFAQTSAVAAALGATMPIVVPRWSGVIVEPHIRRILDRYGLAPDDLRDPHAALGRLARERLPREVRDALARYRAALEESAARLARAIAAEEHPLLPDAVPEGARRSIQHRLDRLERRVVAAAKRREEELVRDLDTARAALFPLGKPQERVLNLIPMLARHGPPLLDAMLERAREHAAQFAPQGAARSVAAFDHAGDHR